MNEIQGDQIIQLLSESRLKVADPDSNIGRHLSLRNGPARTIVVYFIESDVPKIFADTLDTILKTQDKWYLLRRYKPTSVFAYSKSEISNLIESIISHFPRMLKECDDIYLLGGTGKVLMSLDHHIYQDGLAIDFSDVLITGNILSLLNDTGAELELYSARRQ